MNAAETGCDENLSAARAYYAQTGTSTPVTATMLAQPMLTALTVDPALPPGRAVEPKWDGYRAQGSEPVPAATGTSSALREDARADLAPQAVRIPRGRPTFLGGCAQHLDQLVASSSVSRRSRSVSCSMGAKSISSRSRCS